VAVPEHPQAGLDCGGIRVEPVERDLTGAAQQPAHAPGEHLHLGEGVHRLGGEDHHERAVQDPDVVADVDDWSLARDLVTTVDADLEPAPQDGAGQGAQRHHHQPTRSLDPVAARSFGVGGRRHARASTASTRATTWSITSSRV
jgi:hypothetical protein